MDNIKNENDQHYCEVIILLHPVKRLVNLKKEFKLIFKLICITLHVFFTIQVTFLNNFSRRNINTHKMLLGNEK